MSTEGQRIGLRETTGVETMLVSATHHHCRDLTVSVPSSRTAPSAIPTTPAVHTVSAVPHTPGEAACTSPDPHAA